MIYDGPTTTAPLLGKYCTYMGNINCVQGSCHENIFTTSSVFSVVFFSDSATQADGFALRWELIPNPGLLSGEQGVPASRRNFLTRSSLQVSWLISGCTPVCTFFLAMWLPNRVTTSTSHRRRDMCRQQHTHRIPPVPIWGVSAALQQHSQSSHLRRRREWIASSKKIFRVHTNFARRLLWCSTAKSNFSLCGWSPTL